MPFTELGVSGWSDNVPMPKLIPSKEKVRAKVEMPLAAFIVSIDSVEALLGYNLFTQLDELLEIEIESKVHRSISMVTKNVCLQLVVLVDYFHPCLSRLNSSIIRQ